MHRTGVFRYVRGQEVVAAGEAGGVEGDEPWVHGAAKGRAVLNFGLG